MSGHFKVHLKPNERVYINGGVIKVDRKVTIELMNEVVFLLEGHILQEDEATTPLRQLYFIVQVMLMNPDSAVQARQMFNRSLPLLLASFEDGQIRAALKHIDGLVSEGEVYEALKSIRALYPREAQILSRSTAPDEAPLAMAAGGLK